MGRLDPHVRSQHIVNLPGLRQLLEVVMDGTESGRPGMTVQDQGRSSRDGVDVVVVDLEQLGPGGLVHDILVITAAVQAGDLGQVAVEFALEVGKERMVVFRGRFKEPALCNIVSLESKKLPSESLVSMEGPSRSQHFPIQSL